MSLKQLQCPNCNGPLITNDTFTMFTCKACGMTFLDIERDDEQKEKQFKLETKRRYDREEKISAIVVSVITGILFFGMITYFILKDVGVI